MSRRSRWLLFTGVAVAVLAIAAVLAGIFLARSSWLREQVRQRIAAEAETATGGKVDIEGFEFDWQSLTARIRGFVIHGTEPPAAPPLLRVASITVQLKIVSLLERAFDVTSVDAAAPEAHLIVNPDGSTNVPQPKILRPSVKNPVQTVLDLAIGHFSLHDGIFQVNSHRLPWSASGEKLRAQLDYDRADPSYRGRISVTPLRFTAAADLPVALELETSFVLEKNKLTISSAQLQTSRSKADLSGSIDSFSSPDYNLRYTARISLGELVQTLRFRSRPEGMLEIAGAASFRDFGHYLMTGKLTGGSLSFGQGKMQLRDMRAESNYRVDPQQIELTGIKLSALNGFFSGHARIEQLDRIHLEGEASSLDLQRLAQATGAGLLPWDGVLSGPVELRGLISQLNEGKFDARAQLVVSPAQPTAPVHGVLDARYDGFRSILDLGRSFLQLPATRLDFSGILGRQLHVRLQSSDLNELLPAVRFRSDGSSPPLPVLLAPGSAVFVGTVTGPLASPRISGHTALQHFLYSGEEFDGFAGDVDLSNSAVNVQNGSLLRRSLHAQFAGSMGLRGWKPDINATVSVNASLRADVSDLLALAAKNNLSVTGALPISDNLSGSLAAPRVACPVSVTNGSLGGEPIDRFFARVEYENNTATLSDAAMTAGGKGLTFGATYTHDAHDYLHGRLTFEAASNSLPLESLQLTQLHSLPLEGRVQLKASGEAEIARSRTGSPAFHLTAIQAQAEGREIQLAHRPVGAVHLTAKTAGSILNATAESAVANSTIQAQGQWRLEGDYPGTAHLTFTNLDLASLESWLRPPDSLPRISGSLEGKATVSGPALQPEAWTGALEIPRLEIVPEGITTAEPDKLALRNQSPIRLELEKSVVRVQSARLVGQATDVSLTGTAILKPETRLDLNLAGNLDLATIQDFNRDLIASGQLSVDAAVRGPLMQPLINGKLQLRNANLNVRTFANGLSNANGTVLFAANRATIQNITAESGGGKVTITGFATQRGATTDLQLEVAADQVRLRYPEGVSTLANAKLTWTGTSQRSLVSGTVTILRTGFTPRTDFASILASSAQPVRTPAAQTGLLGGINFDVQDETAADVLVQSEIAQQLQVDANLRLRGTASNPALLGRININQGQLTFFGNKYTISQGSVSFFNPVKIEPTLNVDLQTKARGVDVTITVSGPVNKLNVTYRSDPPLQFADIVALLATGRAPTSDPTFAASQTGNAQTWQQLGASALVGQALASPASERLQRFFGVSKIKIDPTLTGITNPQARLTIEQQVTPDVTFTYITYLTQSNPQVVQVEWALNKQVSLVALRDENGLFGLDFYIKKRFK